MNAPASTSWLGLATAVPAAIVTVAGWAADRRVKEAETHADAIACGADILTADPTTARRAEVDPDQVRDAIANGLAVLAHRPGGVTFGGLHWHTADHDGCPGPGAWTLPAPAASREARGAFYTPRALAEEIVTNTLGPHTADGAHEDIACLRVADIACGSGAFLVAAARHIADALLAVWDDYDRTYFAGELHAADAHAAARVIAIGCLYGVDIDPLSVELARLALQLLAPTEPLTALNVRVGDTLVGHGHPDRDTTTFPDVPHRFDWPAQFPRVFTFPGDAASGFDAIVGNPPYLGGLRLTATFGADYREHLAHAVAGGRRGPVDLAVYFWLRAHQLISQYGTVGIIGPAGIDRGANLRAWQRSLANQGRTIYRAEPIRRWPSASAAVGCRILYTTGLRDVEPPFVDREHANPLEYTPHTCGFNVDPPQSAEQWTPVAGCSRCDLLAAENVIVLRVDHDGQAYEIVRHGVGLAPAATGEDGAEEQLSLFDVAGEAA